jgi:hypothetical protein
MKTKYKILITILSIIILFFISIYIFPVKIDKIEPSTIIYDEQNIEI